jgi:hypothetical protein
MDAASAFGLAASVVQFVTFTSDLISKSQAIYKSADGALVEQIELETITQNLMNLTKDLNRQTFVVSRPSKWPTLNIDDRRLPELCEGCQEISKDLLKAIRSLKVEGEHRKWKSFLQALSSIWNESKIDRLRERMDRYRNVIDTHLIVSIRYDMSVRTNFDISH